MSTLAPKTSRSIPWIALVGIFGIIFVVLCLWLPFGLNRLIGVFEEWVFIRLKLEDATTIPANSWPTRPLRWAVSDLAYLIDPHSFFGFNVVLVLLTLGKGLTVYALLRRLFRHAPFIALAGALYIVYPADTGLFTFRSLNLQTSLLFGLLSFYFVTRYWQKHQRWVLVFVWATQFLSLMTYELMYVVYMIYPITLVWINQSITITRQVIRDVLIWYIVPLILGLRVVFILSGADSENYAFRRLNEGVEENGGFFQDVISGLATMYRNHILGWADAFTLFDLHSIYSYLAIMVGIIFFAVAWFHLKPTKDTGRPTGTRQYIAVLSFLILFMFFGFFIYLLTPFRDDTFRVYYLPSLGASVIVTILIFWSGQRAKFGRVGASTLCAGMMTLATLNALTLFDTTVESSDRVQRLMATVAEANPRLDDDVQILVIDEGLLFLGGDALNRNTELLQTTIAYLYGTYYENINFCYFSSSPSGESCSFTSENVLYTRDDLSLEIAYENLIALRTTWDKDIYLLTDLSIYNLADVDYNPVHLVNADAVLPERIRSFFTCWPLENCLPPGAHARPVQTSVHMEFDERVPGVGWQNALRQEGSLLHTRSDVMTIDLKLASYRDYALSFRITEGRPEEAIDNFSLQVNAQAIDLTYTPDDDGFLFEAMIPAEVFALSPDNTILTFIISPQFIAEREEAGRGLPRLTFDWLKIQPVSQE